MANCQQLPNISTGYGHLILSSTELVVSGCDSSTINLHTADFIKYWYYEYFWICVLLSSLLNLWARTGRWRCPALPRVQWIFLNLSWVQTKQRWIPSLYTEVQNIYIMSDSQLQVEVSSEQDINHLSYEAKSMDQ